MKEEAKKFVDGLIDGLSNGNRTTLYFILSTSGLVTLLLLIFMIQTLVS